LDKTSSTAAQIAAAAVFEMFPGVQLWGASKSRDGFYYDLFFPHPIHPDLPFQIEERMRQIVREKREILDLEMAPFSARELLKSQGHLKRAEQIEGKGLVRIVRIGSFADLAENEHLSNTSEVSAFKLFPLIPLEGKGMRIAGAASGTKEELKEFLKRRASFLQRKHEVVGERKNLWRLTGEGVVWLPDGLRLWEETLQTFKEHFFPGAAMMRAPKNLCRHRLYRESGAPAIGEIVGVRCEGAEESGLFEPEEGTAFQVATSFQNAISSLQSIGKTLNILGFDYSLLLAGSKRKERGRKVLAAAIDELQWECETFLDDESLPQVKFLVADGIGNRWSAAEIAADEHLTASAIIERNIALLLETRETGL
jgi:hypothetical protein